MPYATRLIREAHAAAADDLSGAEFTDRLLDALSGDRAVKAAIRALVPVAAKQPVARTPRR